MLGVVPAMAVLLIVGIAAIGAPWLAPSSPTLQNLMVAEERPSADHLLGTDHLGRDLLSRIIHGARVSLMVSTTAALLAAVVGVVIGLLAGYWRGWFDGAASAVFDMQLSFPPVLLAIAIVAALGPNLVNTVIVMAVTTWVVFGRLIRGEVLSLREREYVTAARVVGARDPRIIASHVFPQIMPTLLVMFTLQLGRMIVLEATLSFLGLGVQPPQPSWGNLLADSREYLLTSWWVALYPGIAISLAVWAVNLVGDWLRDELDPRVS
jgi:peptide/nickel transport system permease protein